MKPKFLSSQKRGDKVFIQLWCSGKMGAIHVIQTVQELVARR
jgi:hypothetical protein